MSLILLLGISCKKAPKNSINELISQGFHIPNSDTQLLGILENNSSYTVKVINTNLIFEPNKEFGSYSFGDLLKLDDKKLLCITNRYHVLDDFGYAEFAAKISDDKGMTWNNEELFKSNTSGLNILSPNLLRIDSNHVIFIYAHKINNRLIDIYMQTSLDNAVTFDDAKKINTIQGYQAFNNSRIIRLKSGRIILPVSIFEESSDLYKIFCYYSDDLGKTWQTSSLLSSDVSLMEPGVVELPNGELLMVIRTKQGTLYFSKSNDKGKSWKTLYYSKLVSPDSPGTVLNFKDKLVIFWNDTNYVPNEYRNRTPLNMAISEDNGVTWNMLGKIEANEAYHYSYLSAFSDEEDMYLTYYKRPRQADRSVLVFSKIMVLKK
ncbi:MAG: exo-alpha-sialidase [Pyrinomonadaceae bacterium]|nr:exo-alpha-sialidase [Sphingobacteriaceae bacterium]